MANFSFITSVLLIMLGRRQARRRTGGSNGCAPNPGMPKKKMRRAAKRSSLSPATPPITEEHVGNDEMMELLLDILSHLQAMEAYIAQLEADNREPMQSLEPASVRSPRSAIPGQGITSEPVTWEREVEVHERVGCKMICRLKHAPQLLIESTN